MAELRTTLKKKAASIRASLLLTRVRCLLCLRLCYAIKEAMLAIFGAKLNCRQLHSRTYETSDRVSTIAATAPRCACESQRMSVHSPSPVLDVELLSRFIFSPMHVN